MRSVDISLKEATPLGRHSQLARIILTIRSKSVQKPATTRFCPSARRKNECSRVESATCSLIFHARTYRWQYNKTIPAFSTYGCQASILTIFFGEYKNICRTLSGSTAFMRIVWRSYLASGHSPATRISDMRMTMRLRFGFTYAISFWFLFLSVFLNTKELSAATRYRSLAASDVFSGISSYIFGDAFIWGRLVILCSAGGVPAGFPQWQRHRLCLTMVPQKHYFMERAAAPMLIALFILLWGAFFACDG